MRTLKHGDIVSVSWDRINDLKSTPFIPNFPEKITSTNGTVTSVWRLNNTSDRMLTVRLDDCPDVPNLDFHTDDVTLVIPVELDRRLKAIEDRLDSFTEKG